MLSEPWPFACFVVSGGERRRRSGGVERDSIAAALQVTPLFVQSFTMVRPVHISLIVAFCCLGSAVAQRNTARAFGTGTQQGADYRRLHLTPYHGHGYHGISQVYQGLGTNRVNGYRQ